MAGATRMSIVRQLSSPSREVEGLVLRVDAKVCHVDVDGNAHALPLRGRLFEERTHEHRPVAVGDRVIVVLEEGGGAVQEVLPRRSQLTRTRAGNTEKQQVLAANVSLVLVVSSIREPRFQVELVDRILAGAEREQIPAALVITKMDRDKKGEAQAWRSLYEGLNYRVVCTSIAPGAETVADLGTLEKLLHENITVFCGPSGVGKSSLINTLIPGLGLRVGSIGRIRQGKHTTTHTQLVPLPGGGHVLDSPGIRNFGLYAMKPQELTFLFPEMKSLLPRCEYRNCTHCNEPGCAVREAVTRGEIADSRYRSYGLMLAEVEERGAP